MRIGRKYARKKKEIDNESEKESIDNYTINLELSAWLVLDLAQAAKYENLSVEDYIEKKVRETHKIRRYEFMIGM